MVFLIESIATCAVFTLFVFLMSKNQVKSIFNYPLAIIKRQTLPGAAAEVLPQCH